MKHTLSSLFPISFQTSFLFSVSFTVVHRSGLRWTRRISMAWSRITVPITVRVVPTFRRVIPRATSVMVVSPISLLVGARVVIRTPLVGSRRLVVRATMVRRSVVRSGIVGRMMQSSVAVGVVVSVTVVVSKKEGPLKSKCVIYNRCLLYTGKSVAAHQC